MGTWTPGPNATVGDDLFSGDDTSETANGLGGDDSLFGGSGNDFLTGGNGSDLLVGGVGIQNDYNDVTAGTDTLDGGRGDDVVLDCNSTSASLLIGGDGADQISATWEDVIQAGAGDDLVVLRASKLKGSGAYDGGGGEDTLWIVKGALTVGGFGVVEDFETVIGTLRGDKRGNLFDLRMLDFRLAGTQELTGGRVLGSGGDDTVLGTRRGDYLEGDDPTSDLQDGADLLRGFGGDDSLVGGIGPDSLFGGSGDDYLDSGETVHGTPLGSDLVSGGNGDDTLRGVGEDRINGGSGQDLAVVVAFDDFSSGLEFDLALAAAGKAQSIGGSGSVVNTERIDIVGLTASDRLYGFDYADRLTGGAGGRDRLEGRAGNDTLITTNGDDTLLGGTGDDELTAEVNSTVDGGFGVDTLIYSPHYLLVDVDIEASAAGIAQEIGVGYFVNIERFVFFGGSNDDRVLGGAYDDVLRGGGGQDTLYGRGGDDQIFLGTPYRHSAAYGDAGNDTLEGSRGSDRLDGGGDSDVILGGKGADTIRGGEGADTVSGQASGDTYLFLDGDFADIVTADLVLGFNADEGDVLDLEGIDADVLASGDQQFSYIGQAEFSGAAGELRVVSVSSRIWRIESDTNGDGETDFAFLVESASPLSDEAFVL